MRNRFRRNIEAACRAIFPERTIYVLFESEIPRDLVCISAVAYCGRHLDLIFRSLLESQNRWVGRGAALVVGDRTLWKHAKYATSYNVAAHWRRLLFHMAAHELSHIVLRPITENEKSTSGGFESLAAFVSTKTWCAKDQAPAIADPVPWLGHDGPFLRTVQHVGFRMQQHVDFWLPLQWVDSTIYALSSETAYQRALGDEPQRLAGLPLSAVAEIQPPEAFVDLWRADLRKWFLDCKSPTEGQGNALFAGLKMFEKTKPVPTASPAVDTPTSYGE